MNKHTIVLLIYALLLFVGGYTGYHTAHSLPSLVMGTFFAVALVACSWAISIGINYAYLAAVFLTLLLLVFFFYRFILTIKFMPSGLMSVISLGVLVYLILSRPK